jgi:hypothetical protein
MRLFCALILLIPVVSLVPWQTAAESEESSYYADCEKILADLHDLITGNDSKRDENVYAAIDLCFKKFKEKELSIYIDDSIPRDIFAGVQFQLSLHGKRNPLILISPYMIELYDTRPSIVLSALVHEMQHATSYFQNPEYFVSASASDLERYLYELDAYHVEAVFIITYLVPQKFTLTPFEEALIKSYKEDYLGAFSFNLLGYDMEFTFELITIENQKTSYEEKLTKIGRVLNDLLNMEFKNDGDDWNKYEQTVTIFSAIKFTPQIIYNIEVMHNKFDANDKFDLKKENPEIYGILMKLIDGFNNISTYYYSYLGAVQKKFKTF